MRLAYVTIEVDIDALKRYRPTLEALIISPFTDAKETVALIVARDLFDEILETDQNERDGGQ